MPTRSDITVINQTYDIAGNGGRKLVKMDNGWYVSVAYDSATFKNIVYVSKDNFATTPTQLCWTVGSTQTNNRARPYLVTKGNYIYIFWGKWNTTNDYRVYCSVINATTQTNVDVSGSAAAVFGTNDVVDLGEGSAILNGNYIEVSHAIKWLSLGSSYNIAYRRGTINADGSVTWGTVVQTTSINDANFNFKNPSIVLNSSKNPIILFDRANATDNAIYVVRYNGSNWLVYESVYNGGSYAQSSPSAIFVPQSINGLVNGRIWVAWHGKDSTDTTANNIRVSYSDDGGVTWSAMDKRTSGVTKDRLNPSITANKSNNIDILYSTAYGANNEDINRINFNGSVWSSESTVKASTVNRTFPSTLFDLTINSSFPLFVYRDNAKVGFYGTWTITTISVPEGYIGTKTVDDLNSLLNYSITSDGTMTTITEKVNGVVVGSGMVGSGIPTDVLISEANWDKIHYGKYHNADLLESAVWANEMTASFSMGNPLGAQTPDANHANTQVSCASSTKYQLVLVDPSYEYSLIELDAAQNVCNIKQLYGLSKNFEFITQADTKYLHIEIRRVFSAPTPVVPITGGKFPNMTISQFPLNTLTVEMGSDKWTYTFAKKLSPNVQIESVEAAERDIATTYIPAVKTNLASAINAKGTAYVPSDASFDDLVAGVNSLGGMRSFVGTATSSGSTSTFTYVSGGTVGFYSLTATGIPFKPLFIYAFRVNGGTTDTSTYNELSGDQYGKTIKVAQVSSSSATQNSYHFKGDVAPVSINTGSFTIPVYNTNVLYTYIAFG